ncbi:TolC family protein [Pendulispora brunnea]|uniref:TolC family protein n=1 Tax=Pendulispora brunnea TaxID=2905690 RepID=A0ABZ2K592_9BACT
MRPKTWYAALLTAFSMAQTAPVHAQDGYALTLPGALALARTRGAEIQAARARARAADASADAALAGYLPSLSGQGSLGQTWSRTASPTPTPPGPDVIYRGQHRQLDASAALRWTAFDFWQTPSLVGAARSDARASFQQVKAAANETARLVASAFLTAAYDDLLVENAKTTTRVRERHAAITHGLVASGIRPSVEEARARVELELARLETIDAERQAAQDKVRLATFLLIPPTTPFELVRPQVLPAVSQQPREAAAQAVTRRPEVGASAEQVHARESSLLAAKVARLPTIGAALDASHRAQLGESDPTPIYTKETYLTAQVTVSVPLFDWRVWGQVPVARGQLDAAQAERDATVARVRGEAAEAAYGVQAAHLVLEQSKSTRELAGATLAVMEARYQAGLVTSTDLFDAAARDAEARRGLIRAELGVALAVVQALATTYRMGELER